MHLVDENELHKQWASHTSADLTLTPTDNAASVALKATLGFEKLPSGARAFLEKGFSCLIAAPGVGSRRVWDGGRP